MGVLGVAAIDDVKERTLDFFGDRATAADVVVFAEFDAVELANGRDLGGSAGKEGLIADVDLVAGDAFLHHFQAQVLGNMEHGVARDAVQGPGR